MFGETWHPDHYLAHRCSDRLDSSEDEKRSKRSRHICLWHYSVLGSNNPYHHRFQQLTNATQNTFHARLYHTVASTKTKNKQSNTMAVADLPPSLSSDEEEDVDIEADVEDDEMDEGFEFGGILGEDGGFLETIEGWSFRPDRAPERGLPRMEITDLIAAKRKAMLSKKKEVAKEDASASEEQEQQRGEKEDKASSSSSDEESNDEEEEAKEKTEEENKALERDLLKHRAGNDGIDSESEEDEEEAAEKAKAAEYFQNEEAPVIDRVFTELALSRPLLRGIAAMGFVQPTPIQSSVIPLALQGRDVCASAQTGSGKVSFVRPCFNI